MKKNNKLLKNKDFIYAMICLTMLVIIAAVKLLAVGVHAQEQVSERMEFAEIFDIQMLTSVIAAFFLSSLASLIARRFTAASEDTTKLSNDYDALVRKYEANTQVLSYQNSSQAHYKLGRKRTACKGAQDDKKGDRYRLPIGDILLLYGNRFVVHDDPYKVYSPPEFSKKHFGELIRAHEASNTFNQVNIRVDDIYEVNGTVHAYFSRTTYFDSLVTNRAIDYKIDDVSVRDLYACGPFLKTLKHSLLSNHMGFNGMVETSDNKFIFIKRHKHVSIGKNTLQCSVAASLKAKRALSQSGRLSKEKIASAMVEEIIDELNLEIIEDFQARKESIFKDFSFDRNVLFFYRDLVEGGKPQLMFYAKLDLSSDELKQAYMKGTRLVHKVHRKNDLYCRVDGYKMLLVSREDLKKIYIAPDEMIINNEWYPAVPSAVGTLVMLIQAMDDGLV